MGIDVILATLGVALGDEDDHVAPPGFLDVAFELDAERAVIPEAVQSAIDFARRKDEAAPFAQGDEFFHVHELFP